MKPSTFLRQVMADLEETDKEPGVTWDMGTWYWYRGSDSCSVCAAGGYLLACIRRGEAERPTLDLLNTFAVFCLPDPLKTRMMAINAIRCGAIAHGVEDLGVPRQDARNMFENDDWANVEEMFSYVDTYRRLDKVAERLEEEGY